MIEITNRPSQVIENAYNNQVFEYEGDSEKIAVRSTVIVFLNPSDVAGAFFSSQFLRLNVPANLNKFYINLKKAITNLFNQNNFSDTIVPTSVDYIKTDVSLFCRIGLRIRIFYNDGSQDTLNTDQLYFKSVRNFFDFGFDTPPPSFRLLSETNYFNYYEGLPFDLAFYSDTEGEVIITNETTGVNGSFTFNRGVNRLFLSNGETYNLGFESVVPLTTDRINKLAFTNSNNESLGTIFIKKHKECNAPYLKWFNSLGSWSYYRFEKAFQGNTNHTNRQFLNNDFDNFEDSVGNFQATGKNASRQFTLFTDTLNQDERDYFTSLFISPKIFLYDAPLNAPLTKTSFKEVSLINGTNEDINTKLASKQFNITIELPNINTQAYEN